MFFTSIIFEASLHLTDVSISMGISSMVVFTPKAENRPSRAAIWGIAIAISAGGQEKDKDSLLSAIRTCVSYVLRRVIT